MPGMFRVALRWSLLAGIVIASANLRSVAADASASSWESLDQLAIEGLDRAGARAKFRHAPESLEAWNEQWRREYRNLGMILWDRLPSDPRKWEWLLETVNNPPGYWTKMEPADWSAERRIKIMLDFFRRGQSDKIDGEQRRAWELRYGRGKAGASAWGGPHAQEIETREFLNRLGQTGYLDSLIYASPQRTSEMLRLLSEFVELVRKYPGWDVWRVRGEITRVFRILEVMPAARDIVIQTLIDSNSDYARAYGAKLKQFARLHASATVIAGTTLTGSTIKYPSGKPVLLQAWNVSCGSCVEGMERTQTVAAEMSDKVSVVAVCFGIRGDGQDPNGSERRRAIELLDSKHATFPSLFVTYNEFCAMGFDWNLASHYLFDADGHLIIASFSDEDVIHKLNELIDARVPLKRRSANSAGELSK